MRIEQQLPAMYREMHAKGAFLGETWKAHLASFEKLLGDEKGPVIDYGCGPKGGLAAALGDRVVPYDPYLDEYSQLPWSAGATSFFSCDVFEHMTVSQLREVVRRLRKTASIYRIFLAISTRAANKTLPNGLNAHLIVRSPNWWCGYFEHALGSHFECIAAEVDMLRHDIAFSFVRRAEPEV